MVCPLCQTPHPSVCYATFCYASVMTKYEHCSEKTSSSSSLNDWCEKTNRGYKINANPISSGSELQLYCNANDRYQYLIPSIESFVLRLQDVKNLCRVNLLLIKQYKAKACHQLLDYILNSMDIRNGESHKIMSLYIPNTLHYNLLFIWNRSWL